MAEVLRTDLVYDLRKMAEEAAIARSVLDFDKGPYGNCISLPRADQVRAASRGHINNNPFSGALDRCPYFQSIFDSFQAQKTSFRLLRRAAHAAYSFHDDVDKGPQVIRFQIPFVTSTQAFLLIANDSLDISRFDTDSSGFAGDSKGDVWFDMPSLQRAAAGALELFYLDAGHLHFFETNQVHTLINAATEERITLSIDLILNDWLREWMRVNLTTRVPPSPIDVSSGLTWKWNNLRSGIIYSQAPPTGIRRILQYARRIGAA
jgi:hypothetical protein